MLINLLKKDFILVKKYILFSMIFMIIGPIIMSYKTSIIEVEKVLFLVISIMLEYMLYNTLAMIEEKYKGSIYLCIAPYTRDMLVKSKYVFVLANFFILYIVYTITSFILPTRIEKLSIINLSISLLVVIIYFAVFIPIQYKFGYERTRYVSFGLMFIIPFVAPSILKLSITTNFNKIILPSFIEVIFIYIAILVITTISIKTSIYIYSRKEL